MFSNWINLLHNSWKKTTPFSIHACSCLMEAGTLEDNEQQGRFLLETCIYLHLDTI
jgi:hypothetical protein